MQQLIETLNKVFKGKHTGTYLDIGAYDGVTNNVTHWFYQHGWRGICVEPQTKYFKMGVAERPEDRWVKGVVVGNSHIGKTATFYEDPSGLYSGMVNWDNIAINHYQKTHGEDAKFPGMKKKNLKSIKINDDIPTRRFEDGLDLIVISTTGTEFDVLESIDLGKWKPNIVVIPDDFRWADWADGAMSYFTHMQTMGYYQLAPDEIDNWLVFSNDYEDGRNA